MPVPKNHNKKFKVKTSCNLFPDADLIPGIETLISGLPSKQKVFKEESLRFHYLVLKKAVQVWLHFYLEPLCLICLKRSYQFFCHFQFLPLVLGQWWWWWFWAALKRVLLIWKCCGYIWKNWANFNSNVQSTVFCLNECLKRFEYFSALPNLTVDAFERSATRPPSGQRHPRPVSSSQQAPNVLQGSPGGGHQQVSGQPHTTLGKLNILQGGFYVQFFKNGHSLFLLFLRYILLHKNCRLQRDPIRNVRVEGDYAHHKTIIKARFVLKKIFGCLYQMQ